MKSKSLNLRMDLQALPDEAVIPRKEKGFGEEKEMKKGLYYSLHLFSCAQCLQWRFVKKQGVPQV